MQKYHLHNRPNREIKSESEIAEILKRGKYVSIAMCRNNEPYIITLSYGYDSQTNALYFHTSKEGLKHEFLKENSLVCATVIEDGGYVQDHCEHHYKSIVFWGNMKVLDSLEDKKYGMNVLLNHLEEKPDIVKGFMLKSDAFYPKMDVLKLEIIQIHGKEGS